MDFLWVELLVAAAFGGAIGWALHMMYGKRAAAAPAPVVVGDAAEAAARATELESQLAKSTSEIDDLRQKSGIAAPGKEGAPVPEGSLAWRNRHLESRVRFLEGKVADLDTGADRGRPAEDQNDEATRLRWRNRYLEGRVKYLEEELVRTGGLTPSRATPHAVASQPPAASSVSPVRAKAPAEGDKPDLIEAPRDDKADDLKQISGIGPKLEQKLNSIGIWHYDQIAAWSQAQVDWVNAAISFRGRIEREKWVPQARALVQGAGATLETAPESSS